MRRKIIIDTDPSPDDALTFLLALAHPDQFDVLALTTVGGNVPLSYTTRNALMTLELINRPDIPVYAGASGPLCGELVTAEHVHGTTGFDGYDLPEPSLEPADGFAPDRIVELLLNEDDASVTLCCIAPLTNIALAMIQCPQIVKKIASIVMMAGSRSEGGNITPAAEYNFSVDPEAAEKVLNSGVPIVMIPLDCTHQALTTKKRLQQIRAIGSPVSEAFYQLLVFNKQFDEQLKQTDGGPLHDPTVVAYLLEPDIFEGKQVNVQVECHGTYTRGMSVVDWWQVTDRPENVLYMNVINADRYFELVTNAIATFK